MDEVIRELQELRKRGELSDESHGVLIRLAKKRKKERYWFNLKSYIGYALAVFYLLLLVTLQPVFNAQGNYYKGFMDWLTVYSHISLAAAIIISHLALKIVSDKYDEVDGKYDRLRKEVIDREVELWNRHMMDRLSRPSIMTLFDEHKVNIFHK